MTTTPGGSGSQPVAVVGGDASETLAARAPEPYALRDLLRYFVRLGTFGLVA